MRDWQSDPPPEFVLAVTARDLAYEAMLRTLFDAMSAMLVPETQEAAKMAAVTRAIQMIQAQPLDDMQPDLADRARAKAADKVKDVFGASVRKH